MTRQSGFKERVRARMSATGESYAAARAHLDRGRPSVRNVTNGESTSISLRDSGVPGEVLTYNVPKRRLPEWVAEQFSRLGTKADAEACRALVEIVGDDLDELSSEVQKLATWAGGEPIAARDVERLAVGGGETAIFSLTDAWGRRDVAGRRHVHGSCLATTLASVCGGRPLRRAFRQAASQRPRKDHVPPDDAHADLFRALAISLRVLAAPLPSQDTDVPIGGATSGQSP